LKVWSSFKEKVNKLKLNYQTYLSLLLPPQQISALEQELHSKRIQLAQYNQKQTPARLLTVADEKKQNELYQQTKELEKELDNQKELRNINWKTFFQNKRWLRVERKQSREYFEQLRDMHKKHDRVVDLVKAKNWTKLEQLLLQGKIG